MTYEPQSLIERIQVSAFPLNEGHEARPSRSSDVRDIVLGPPNEEDIEPDAEGEDALDSTPTAKLIDASLERLHSAQLVREPAQWHLLVVVVRGSERLILETGEQLLTPGDVIIVPCGATFGEQPDGHPPVDRLFIAFESPEIDDEAVATCRDSAGRIRELAAWLVNERRASFPGAALYRECTLGLLLAELRRLRADACSVLERQTRAYVVENMERAITLQQLATNVGMSRHYFCRLYHRLTGESPMTTVRNLKLERARELVLSSNLSLRAIAGQVGFSSQYHLSRVIRSHFGVGMKELRAAARRNAPAA